MGQNKPELRFTLRPVQKAPDAAFMKFRHTDIMADFPVIKPI